MKKALELPVQQLQQMASIGTAKVKQEHNITIEAQKLATLLRESQKDTESDSSIVPVSTSVVPTVAISTATNN